MKEVDNIAQLQSDIQQLEKRYGQLQLAHSALEKRFEELKTNKNLLVETILTNEAKEKNYRKIIDHSPSALFLTKPDGTILEANQTSFDMLGYTEAEFRKMGRAGFIDHENVNFRKLLDERKARGHATGEIIVIKKNGERIPAEASSFIFKDPSNGEERSSTILTDISDRVKAEKALLDSEKNYRDLFNLNPLPMWIYDMETTGFLAVNEAAVTHYGYSREEFLQMTICDIRPLEEKEKLLLHIGKGYTHIGKYHGYWKHCKKNGEIIHVEITSQTVNYAGRNARLILSNDITGKIQVESKLIKSNRRLQTSQQIAKLGYWEMNLLTQELYLSEQSYAILGLQPSEIPLTYERFFRMIHPDDRKYFIKKQNAVLNGQKKVTVEHRVVLDNGVVKTLIETGNLIFNEAGVAIFFEGTVQDITERKKAQEKLDKSREWADLIFSNTTDLMFLIEVTPDQERYRCLKVNPAYLELTGLTAEMLIGKCPHEFLPEEAAEFATSKYHRAIHERKTIVYEEDVHLPLTHIIVETKLTPVFNDIGEPILLLGVARNITERKKAEKIIADNERRMKIAQFVGNVGDWEFDCSTGKLNWSDELFRLFAKDPATGAPQLEEFISLYAPDDTLLRNAIREALENGTNYELDLQLSLPNEPSAYHYAVGQVLKNNEGSIIKLYGIVQDITERKRAEIKLNAEHNLLRTLIDTLPDSIYIKDTMGRKIITNRVDMQLMGVKSEEEVIGKTDMEIFSGNMNVSGYADDIEVIQTGKPIFNREESFFDENGTEVFILTSKVPILNENGAVSGLLGIGRIITERKQAELALKESNERYLYVTQATSDAIWDWDILHDHFYWGEGYEKIFGYKIPDKVENHIDSFENIHPDDSKQVFTHIYECLAGNVRNWESAYRYKKEDGNYAFVEDKGIIIRDAEGKAIRMIGAMQDVTERKSADEAIKNTQEKFISLVNTVECIVWEADVNSFQSIYISEYAEKLLGYPLSKWFNEPDFWTSHLHPDDRDWVVEYCHQCIRDKKNYQFEYRMIAADGRVVWLSDIANILIVNNEAVRLSGITVDISERKKMEETLTNERKLLRVLIDNLPDYIYVKDKEMRHVINNKANIQLLGFTSEEDTINKTIVQLLGEDIGREFLQDDLLVLNTGHSIINREEPMYDKEGHLRWLLTTKIPIRDETNVITGLVGISKDITERKKTDEELLEKNDQLKNLSKHLFSIREEERKLLAREVHDELGQLASVVKMDIDWLTLRLTDITEATKKRMEHASSTADLLINTVRKIASNLRPSMLDELGLHAALAWQCKEFSSVNGIACEFEQVYDDENLAIEIKTELFRICQESLTNIMRHAAATRVWVTINETKEGLRMRISDNGKGFDTNQKKNTLGLIGMRERALSINGTLTLVSKPGKGTTICIIIPSNSTI